jgi:hypothetical protein
MKCSDTADHNPVLVADYAVESSFIEMDISHDIHQRRIMIIDSQFSINSHVPFRSDEVANVFSIIGCDVSEEPNRRVDGIPGAGLEPATCAL